MVSMWKEEIELELEEVFCYIFPICIDILVAMIMKVLM